MSTSAALFCWISPTQWNRLSSLRCFLPCCGMMLKHSSSSFPIFIARVNMSFWFSWFHSFLFILWFSHSFWFSLSVSGLNRTASTSTFASRVQPAQSSHAPPSTHGARHADREERWETDVTPRCWMATIEFYCCYCGCGCFVVMFLYCFIMYYLILWAFSRVRNRLWSHWTRTKLYVQLRCDFLIIPIDSLVHFTNDLLRRICHVLLRVHSGRIDAATALPCLLLQLLRGWKYRRHADR
jgi:hypothetical protein